MAVKATILKAELQVSDMDRHYYASHALTLALSAKASRRTITRSAVSEGCWASVSAWLA